MGLRSRVAATGAAVGVGALVWRALGVGRRVPATRDYWTRRADAAPEGALVYLALGDSAAQGIGARAPEAGYVGVLANRITEATGRPVRVVNLSVAGAKAADVLGTQVDRVSAYAPDVVTLAIGGNDAGRTPAADFRRQLAAICDGLPPGAYVADVPDFQGGPRRAAAAELARVARDVVAQRPSLVAAPLEALTGSMRWRDYSPDFFHPNDAGYLRWADAFWSVMAPRLVAATR